jgi:hypothetical protein
MNSKIMYVIYLIIFSITGVGLGYIFNWVYLLLGNEPSDDVLNIFIFVWTSFGLLAGFYGVYVLRKINRSIQK